MNTAASDRVIDTMVKPISLHYREMLAAIRAALRPGGRPVILDGEPAATDRALTRERQFSRHVMARSLVENELVEAGFRMLLSRPAFARLHQGETAWLLAAEPASGAE